MSARLRLENHQGHMHNAGVSIGDNNLGESLTKRQTKRPSQNQLRIIGGKWRGRKIQFPNVEDLRPTSDRIRETVFNWLTPWIEGAHCLDLFAGSGALGLEAASRGADRVILVDNSKLAIDSLTSAQSTLDASSVSINHADASVYLRQYTDIPFDIIFLDPPFALNNIQTLLETLANLPILKPKAWIYLETAANTAIVTPQQWRLHREKQAGQVTYRLYQRSDID